MVVVGIISIIILLSFFRAFQIKPGHKEGYMSMGLFYTGFVLLFYVPLVFFDLSYYTIEEDFRRAIPLLLMIIFLFGVLFLEKQSHILFRQGDLKYKGVNTRGLVLFSVFLAILGLLLYRGIPPTINNFASLVLGTFERSQLLEVQDFREEVTKSHIFGGDYAGQGALRMILKNGIYILVNAVLLDHLLFGKRRKALVFVFIFSLFFLLGEGSRSPVLFLLFTNFVTYVSVKQVNWKLYLFGGLGVVSIMLVLTAFTKSGTGINTSEVLTSLVERTFIGNSGNDLIVVEMLMDERLEFRYGEQHYRDILSALPGKNEFKPFAYELYTMLYSNSTTTFLTGTYFTKVFLDFGFLSPVFVLFVFMVVVLLYKFLIRVFPSRLLAILLISTFGLMLYHGIIGVVINSLLLIVLYHIFRIFNKLSL